MIEQLNKSIKQLRKVNNVLELCEKLLNVDDDTVMNTIYEASTNIDNAANAISEIVGREILAKRYYTHSLFEIKGDQDDMFDGAGQDQEGLTTANDSFPTDSDDNNEKEDRISELREVVDRADEILNHNKEERKDEGYE